MKRTGGAVILAICLFACKKSENDLALPTKGDYFPLTPSSNWNYVPANSNTGIVLFSEVLGTQRTVDGNSYSVVSYSPGNTRFANFFDSSLFRKDGSKYYQSISYQQLDFPLDEPGNYEFMVLRANSPVGTTWNKPISGTYSFSNGKLRMEEDYQGKITAFFPTYQLDETHSFSDVIQVTTNMYARGFNSNNELVIENSDVYDKWYARDIGLIKAVDHTPSGFSLKLDTLLVH